MKGAGFRCDGCGAESVSTERVHPDRQRPLPGWLTLTTHRPDHISGAGQSEDVHHFCGFDCLHATVTGESSAAKAVAS